MFKNMTIKDIPQGELEKKARNSTVCPICGEKKEAGPHSQIVCWGECWRGKDGLKYTTLDVEDWLERGLINAKN